MFPVCRSPDYYVDPFSQESIELGTQKYPYRSISSVNSEIINFHSHTNVTINIYTKSTYIQQDTLKFFNMSAVSIMSHPDLQIINKKAVIIPTTVPQVGIFEKSAFHLLNFTTLNVQMAIGLGSFTQFEMLLMITPKISLMPIRTSLSLIGIDIYSDETITDSTKTFILPIFLQEKGVKISKQEKFLAINKEFYYSLLNLRIHELVSKIK